MLYRCTLLVDCLRSSRNDAGTFWIRYEYCKGHHSIKGTANTPSTLAVPVSQGMLPTLLSSAKHLTVCIAKNVACTGTVRVYCDKHWDVGSIVELDNGRRGLERCAWGVACASRRNSSAMPSVERQPVKPPKGYRRGEDRTSPVALGKLAKATRSRPLLLRRRKRFLVLVFCKLSPPISRMAPHLLSKRCNATPRGHRLWTPGWTSRVSLVFLWQEVAGRVPLMFIVLGTCYLFLGMVGSSMISPPPLGSLAQGQ